MKKIIAILFLVVLCISHMGYYFIYRFQQRQIKREMEAQLFAKIPESSLEVFIVEEHRGAIQWKENGKEFSLNGEMYDVAKTKQENGKTMLYCINDKKEKQLLKNFTKAMKADAGNGKSGKSSIKFQLSDYTINYTEKKGEDNTVIKKKFIVFNSTLLTSIKEINAPPPKA